MNYYKSVNGTKDKGGRKYQLLGQVNNGHKIIALKRKKKFSAFLKICHKVSKQVVLKK